MTATTIKVPIELRDRLNAEARSAGVTAAQVIEQLFAERARADRFRAMRAARDAMTAADRVALQRDQQDIETAALADFP